MSLAILTKRNLSTNGMDLDSIGVVPNLGHNKSNHSQIGFTLPLNDCLYHKDVMV